MDRRKFLQISVAGAAAVSIPMVHCKTGRESIEEVLALPALLSNFCDEKAIREIGQAYRQKFPAENKPGILKNILLTDKDGKFNTMSNDAGELVSFLKQKIHDDFQSSNTVILKGWVLSVTEARQCALYSLKQP